MTNLLSPDPTGIASNSYTYFIQKFLHPVVGKTNCIITQMWKLWSCFSTQEVLATLSFMNIATTLMTWFITSRSACCGKEHSRESIEMFSRGYETLLLQSKGERPNSPVDTWPGINMLPNHSTRKRAVLYSNWIIEWRFFGKKQNLEWSLLEGTWSCRSISLPRLLDCWNLVHGWF